MRARYRNLRLFADGLEMAQGCRMTLTARSGVTILPNLHRLKILDLSESSAATLSGARQIEVRSGNSILAFGRLIEALTRTSGGERITDLVFSPDFPVNVIAGDLHNSSAKGYYTDKVRYCHHSVECI